MVAGHTVTHVRRKVGPDGGGDGTYSFQHSFSSGKRQAAGLEVTSFSKVTNY